MKKILFILLIFNTLISIAQNGTPLTGGARGAAMGNASVAFTDINSAFSNQAGLANLQSLSFTALAEQRFFISELQTLSVAAALPTASGTFGLTINHFGFEGFNQQKIGVAYARKLLDELSIGAQILALNTRIPEYGSKASFTFELGFLMQVLPELRLGVHTYSPMQIELVEGENLPTVFKIGLAYLPSERVTCSAEVEKDIDFPARAKFGIEYQLVEQFNLRVGAATNPTNLAFGVGYGLKNGLIFDLASVYHQFLGFTPTVSVSFQRKKS
ncbi:MAG: hypothetical protein IPJ74_12885 [Saprospiraceae bacterium]|nr:hypothetical protein [Saprospiraceae bacterium]